LSKGFSARVTDDSSTKADEKHVSPAIAKPNVSSRFGHHIILLLAWSILCAWRKSDCLNEAIPFSSVRSNVSLAAKINFMFLSKG
jgi:hypothetical protein